MPIFPANQIGGIRFAIPPYALNVHLLASIPNGIWAENMGLLDDLWVDPLMIKSGMITALERPGHGLRFRDEVRREVAR